MDTLLRLASEIQRLVQSTPGAVDVKTEQVSGLPLLTILPRRIELARYGLTIADVQDAVSVAMGGRETGLIYAVVPVSLLLIFMLLFMTFNSVKDALLVFSGVPLALTRGVLALLLRGIPLSITAGVGFITLSGVAVLTGVVMVSAIRDIIRQGIPIEEAITRDALLRLRPILMIGLVASLGFLPMALNTGTGAEVQRPLATVVIGGIVSSTALSLLVLPALYRLTTKSSSLTLQPRQSIINPA